MLSDHERTGIHVTDITGCLRKAWYEKTQTQPEYLHSRAYLLMGNAMHEYLEHHGDSGDAERKIEAMGIEGTMDVYRDGMILDSKSTRWLTPSKLPYGSHAMQVNIYAEMMRCLGHEVKRLFVQYIDMSGPTKCKTCKAIFAPDETGYLSCPRCGREYSGAHMGAELIEIDQYPREEMQQYINERRDMLTNALESMEAPAQGSKLFMRLLFVQSKSATHRRTQHAISSTESHQDPTEGTPGHRRPFRFWQDLHQPSWQRRYSQERRPNRRHRYRARFR